MCVDRWNIVREQAGLILGKGSHFVGDIWTEWIDNESLPPLHLDANEWAGSVESYDGDTEFVMKYNGDEFSFRPMEHPFWGVGDPGVRPGTWLSVESEYTGISVNSDPSGCLWAKAIEWATMFLGRPPAETGDEALGVFELLDRPEANGDFTIELITSDFLAPGQLAEMVRLLADKDPNFDPEAVAVSCPEFAGTAEQLLTQEPQT